MLRRSKSVADVIAASERGYVVLEDGSVVSPSGRVLSASPTGGSKSCPYMRVSCGRVSVCVHQLAGYQKFGERALFVGIQIRHKDGNSVNNATDNILIGTPAENHADIPAHVRERITRLAVTSSAHKKRKLSDSQVREVRALHSSGVTVTESRRATARRMGVSKVALHLVITGVTYQDVKQEGS